MTTREIPVCPECESSQTNVLSARYGGERGKVCNDCGHRFRDYAHVETNHGDNRRGLAGKLAAANPDDLGGSA